jgi:hypothetical protein
VLLFLMSHTQGQLACRQLEQRLAEELELRPNNPAAPHLQKMLQRTRDNLGEMMH